MHTATKAAASGAATIGFAPNKVAHTPAAFFCLRLVLAGHYMHLPHIPGLAPCETSKPCHRLCATVR